MRQDVFSLQGNAVASDAAPIPEEAAAETKTADDALVTTRRGKKKQAKRKFSGDGADPNPRPEEGRAQVSARGRGASPIASS